MTVLTDLHIKPQLTVIRAIVLVPLMALALMLGLLTAGAAPAQADTARDYRGFFDWHLTSGERLDDVCHTHHVVG